MCGIAAQSHIKRRTSAILLFLRHPPFRLLFHILLVLLRIASTLGASNVVVFSSATFNYLTIGSALFRGSADYFTLTSTQWCAAPKTERVKYSTSDTVFFALHIRILGTSLVQSRNKRPTYTTVSHISCMLLLCRSSLGVPTARRKLGMKSTSNPTKPSPSMSELVASCVAHRKSCHHLFHDNRSHRSSTTALFSFRSGPTRVFL